ncbi:uncharacterized protein LOC130760495 isoform X2 [Actinidia eriantha]|uniref:uncharacterized protein LOC130760495 isoform X2 n=1 Tax=Actinidia eriantha TaxID=165200 RepID=UPI002586A4DE|nr:uncharacterized protein LOC130760495 isoform X2 [Actinidia eriantha]XP_057471827.1 uncharacterized protein LOC130760495 isoform X2 [Actinidia eriantha]
MEESADWRLRYDEAVERASKCTKELIEIKKSLKKVEDAAGINKKLEMLQKVLEMSCYCLHQYAIVVQWTHCRRFGVASSSGGSGGGSTIVYSGRRSNMTPSTTSTGGSAFF